MLFTKYNTKYRSKQYISEEPACRVVTDGPLSKKGATSVSKPAIRFRKLVVHFTGKGETPIDRVGALLLADAVPLHIIIIASHR